MEVSAFLVEGCDESVQSKVYPISNVCRRDEVCYCQGHRHMETHPKSAGQELLGVVPSGLSKLPHHLHEALRGAAEAPAPWVDEVLAAV